MVSAIPPMADPVRPSIRRQLLRNALSALIALDLAALSGLIADQWFIERTGHSLGFALALLPPMFALSRPLSDAVLVMADRHAGIPDAGERIPTTGQSPPDLTVPIPTFPSLRQRKPSP